jgi:thiamine kinase-like enzyme
VPKRKYSRLSWQVPVVKRTHIQAHPQALQQALSSWPYWSVELAAEPRLKNLLNAGKSHNTYLVSSGSQQFALRLENPNSRDLAMAKNQEVSLMQTAGALAPTVVWSDKHTLVTEFIHGTPWQPPDNLERLCQALQHLHRQNLPLPAFDLQQHCDNYWQKIQQRDRSAAGLAADLFARCRQFLANTLSTYPEQVLCHNDLNADNILCRGNDFIFLDWEYSCYNSPYFDLATLVECFDLGDVEEQQLSDFYWSDEQQTAHLQALQAFRIVVRFTEWLWLTLKQEGEAAHCKKRLEHLLSTTD